MQWRRRVRAGDKDLEKTKERVESMLRELLLRQPFIEIPQPRAATYVRPRIEPNREKRRRVQNRPEYNRH